MSYDINIAIDLMPRTNQKYYISAAHRRVQKNKSRWLIATEQEVECFIVSQQKLWIEDGIAAWGVIKEENSLVVLGKNSQNEPLKIAKFVAKNNDGIWHGYPADFCRNDQDRPGIPILQMWRSEACIEKHHIIKIRQGKACNL